jgi:hypothetical protein
MCTKVIVCIIVALWELEVCSGVASAVGGTAFRGWVALQAQLRYRMMPYH